MSRKKYVILVILSRTYAILHQLPFPVGRGYLEGRSYTKGFRITSWLVISPLLRLIQTEGFQLYP